MAFKAINVAMCLTKAVYKFQIAFVVAVTILISSTQRCDIFVSGLEASSWANIAWGFDNLGEDDTNGVDVVLLDLDDQAHLIQGFKNANQVVICYLSGGTYESFRTYEDESLWIDLSVEIVDGFENEQWLDISRLEELKTILIPRFNQSLDSGCDAVEVDNVDCFDNSNCRDNLAAGSVSKQQLEQFQLDFNIWQTEYVHSIGLEIGLKNSLALIEDLVDHYDFAVNEQCAEFDECSDYKPFTSANKPVFHVEYKYRRKFCKIGHENGFLTKVCQHKLGEDGVCTGKSWTTCDGDYLPLSIYSPEVIAALVIVPVVVLFALCFLRRRRGQKTTALKSQTNAENDIA